MQYKLNKKQRLYTTAFFDTPFGLKVLVRKTARQVNLERAV